MKMRIKSGNDELRWQIIKTMLDEFPNLKEKVKEYLEKQN